MDCDLKEMHGTGIKLYKKIYPYLIDKDTLESLRISSNTDVLTASYKKKVASNPPNYCTIHILHSIEQGQYNMKPEMSVEVLML